MVHIHNGILLSCKKKLFESVVMRWMKLEPIIQGEVSQKEKQILCVCIYMCVYIWNSIYIWNLERWQ